MGVRLTWTDCDKAGDYVVLNVLSPRDLVSKLDNMDETVLHTRVLPNTATWHESLRVAYKLLRYNTILKPSSDEFTTTFLRVFAITIRLFTSCLRI